MGENDDDIVFKASVRLDIIQVDFCTTFKKVLRRIIGNFFYEFNLKLELLTLLMTELMTMALQL